MELKSKLGPILWQFPPGMKFHADKWEAFLKLLPHDVKAASKLARKHTDRVEGRAFVPSARAPNHRLRHAVEVRHPSFDDPAFFELLERFNVALVTADSGGKYPYFEKTTADFVYLRLHGPAEMYVDGYDEAALDKWAAKVKAWGRTKDVFAYFDNDVKVHAPFDAVSLLERTIKGYAPAEPMDVSTVENLRTPGPRMTDDDPRWRRRERPAKKPRRKRSAA
jgi:uncharacterized protein YecE (DUF72 family)